MTPQLQSDDSPVGTEPMSNEAASWLGGALCIGGLIGTPLVAAVAEKFGRKVAGCLIVLPHGVCWLLTIFAEDQNYLFVARFFAGIAGAGAILVIPLYIGEIASDKIRGMLGSLLVFFVNAGILAAYILGSLVSFHVFAICAAVLPIVHLAAFVFMPETPTYLVRCNRMAEAGRYQTQSSNTFLFKNCIDYVCTYICNSFASLITDPWIGSEVEIRRSLKRS